MLQMVVQDCNFRLAPRVRLANSRIARRNPRDKLFDGGKSEIMYLSEAIGCGFDV